MTYRVPTNSNLDSSLNRMAIELRKKNVLTPDNWQMFKEEFTLLPASGALTFSNDSKRFELSKPINKLIYLKLYAKIDISSATATSIFLPLRYEPIPGEFVLGSSFDGTSGAVEQVVGLRNAGRIQFFKTSGWAVGDYGLYAEGLLRIV